MTIEIPEDQVPPSLTEANVRALIAFAARAEPGARFEALCVGEGEIDIRVDDRPAHYERVSIDE